MSDTQSKETCTIQFEGGPWDGAAYALDPGAECPDIWSFEGEHPASITLLKHLDIPLSPELGTPDQFSGLVHVYYRHGRPLTNGRVTMTFDHSYKP